MKFKTILDNIQNEGRSAIHRIEADTKRQIEEINRTTEESAEKQRSRILADGRARLSRETALIEQQAAVKSLQIHADARQKLIDSVLAETRQAFSDIRSRADYPRILFNLVEEVISSLSPSLINGQRIILHFDDCDQETIRDLMESHQFDVETRFDLKTDGGCFGETSDGKVTSNNTLDSRFQRASALLQQKLSLYFEEKVSSV
jgi:V/A-type H+-transporting ATPase subunit E